MTETKKNKKMVLLVLLTLLIVLSIAFVGTLAKYTTSNSGEDSAVVAEFGLNVPATFDLFAESYDNALSNTDNKKIIAPGTSGSHEFVISGTSEVAYTVSADIEVEYSSEWGSYKPLEFSLDGTNWTSFADFKTNLSEALASETMAPNALYSSESSIYWRWPFSTSPENDEKDTEMGLMATTETAPQVTVSIEVIATQID